MYTSKFVALLIMHYLCAWLTLSVCMIVCIFHLIMCPLHTKGQLLWIIGSLLLFMLGKFAICFSIRVLLSSHLIVSVELYLLISKILIYLYNLWLFSVNFFSLHSEECDNSLLGFSSWTFNFCWRIRINHFRSTENILTIQVVTKELKLQCSTWVKLSSKK